MQASGHVNDTDGFSLESRSRLAQFVADANQALRFRLVRLLGAPERADDFITEDVLPDDFHPEMTHQVFGEQENIFGFRDLRILLQMTAGSLQAYLTLQCSESASPAEFEGVKPDSVLPPLVNLLTDGQLCTSAEKFRRYLVEEERKFKPMGQKVHEWAADDDKGSPRAFEVYQCDHATPGFLKYHARLQPWIMFYIDAASYIDADDPNWLYFTVFERHLDLDGQTSYSVCGYMTVYKYYAYPSNTRPRISQMLILPPYQRLGLGARLLDTAQRFFWKNKDVIDITVEDPSEGFIRLRDFVDCSNCHKLLPCFADPVKLKAGFSNEMLNAAKSELKICKRQARRVYEILRLKATNREDETDYRAYRVDVKRRLNLPFVKEERQLLKLKRVLKPEEFAATTVNVVDRKTRLTTLQSQYAELEEHYTKIIQRLQDQQE